MKVSRCKKCGKEKPTYGPIEGKTKKAKKPKEKIIHHKPVDYDKLKDPHIGDNEKYYVSTLHRK